MLSRFRPHLQRALRWLLYQPQPAAPVHGAPPPQYVIPSMRHPQEVSELMTSVHRTIHQLDEGDPAAPGIAYVPQFTGDTLGAVLRQSGTGIIIPEGLPAMEHFRRPFRPLAKLVFRASRKMSLPVARPQQHLNHQMLVCLHLTYARMADQERVIRNLNQRLQQLERKLSARPQDIVPVEAPRPFRQSA